MERRNPDLILTENLKGLTEKMEMSSKISKTLNQNDAKIKEK